MRKQVMILLAGALLAISSCSKSSNSATSVNAPENTNVPYWGNYQQLSTNGGSDKMTLTVDSIPVTESNPTAYTVTSHIIYNDQDYLVNNIDSITNSPVSPYVYHGHKISIIGSGVSYTGTYTRSVIYNSNDSEAYFVLTIYPSVQPMVFGNLMYTGQGRVPGF